MRQEYRLEEVENVVVVPGLGLIDGLGGYINGDLVCWQRTRMCPEQWS